MAVVKKSNDIDVDPIYSQKQPNLVAFFVYRDIYINKGNNE